MNETMAGSELRGTGRLFLFRLRIERRRTSIWALAVSIFVSAYIPVINDLLFTAAAPDVIIDLMKNPAMIAIVGPLFGEDYTLGASYANYMLVFSLLAPAIMSIILVSSNLRRDEELGRDEILKAKPVGRLANAVSIMLVNLAANLLVFVLSFVFMSVAGAELLSQIGILNFTLSIFVVGLFFGSAALLFSQLFRSHRAVTGADFSLLFASYILRAVGDLYLESLSYISPLGLLTRAQAFVENKFTPHLILFLLSLVLVIVSLILEGRRDLASSVLPERKREKVGLSYGLSSVNSLSVRLSINTFLGWLAALIILSAMYGTVIGDMQTYLESSEMLKAIFSPQGGNFTRQFLYMLAGVMSIITSVPALVLFLGLRTEEKRGYSELVLARAVSRSRYLGSYLGISLVSSLLLQLASAVSLILVAGNELVMLMEPLEFVTAMLNFLPAIWFLVGLATLLLGVLPRLTSFVYIYLAFSFIVIYLGRMTDMPEFIGNLTPFNYIPQHKLTGSDYQPLAIILALTLFMIIGGFVSYRRRD